MPVVGLAVDWVNRWNMEPFWTVDWVVRDDLVVNLSQRYIVTPHGNATPIFSTWGARRPRLRPLGDQPPDHVSVLMMRRASKHAALNGRDGCTSPIRSDELTTCR